MILYLQQHNRLSLILWILLGILGEDGGHVVVGGHTVSDSRFDKKYINYIFNNILFISN